LTLWNSLTFRHIPKENGKPALSPQTTFTDDILLPNARKAKFICAGIPSENLERSKALKISLKLAFQTPVTHQVEFR
jgi:hypothetical protein